MPTVPDIRVQVDRQALAEAVAGFVLTLGEEAVRSKGRFSIALSGGSTPEILYQALASPGFANRFDWSRTNFFFSDERCVPPDNAQSNYALANRTLFRPLNISSSRVFRMVGESQDHQKAAYEYEQQLRLETKTPASIQPSLDLVLLGLGEDGHTASLFPGTETLREHHRLVAVTQSPKDPPSRLTMTLGVINRASVVLFLVTGAGKAGVVRAVLDPKTHAERELPAALVAPLKGRLIWFLDCAAASQLPGYKQTRG